ncbi:MAG TPA: nucleotidyltransferase [Firmicutes bacterium]|nr:nucleotidyltransferase [Bacillota bacterium]
MEVPIYFADFLKGIRPTSSQIQDYQTGHRTLRQRLMHDDDLRPIIVCTFIQGSYRRATAIRPIADKRPDVDVVVVTRLDKDKYTPIQAMNKFKPFLDKYYSGKYRFQGRSIGITLSYVDLDLVITSAPSEVDEEGLSSKSVTSYDTPEDTSDWRLVRSWVPVGEKSGSLYVSLLEAPKKEAEWKLSPLCIPDRETKTWERTHPLAQIQWTWAKNNKCNGHYVNVVKALKWWKQVMEPDPEKPKGYPLEHLVGICCPDGIGSVAEGVTLTLEAIASQYPTKPILPDHGVPEHDVMARVSDEDYEAFHEKVSGAAKIARRALDSDDFRESVLAWQELFGKKFPGPTPPSGNKNGFTPRAQKTQIGSRRFA